jgi:replicative DNA helicase
MVLTEPLTKLHDVKAEQCLLACLLRDGNLLDDVAPPLAAQDFYADAHQRVFTALAGMRSRGQVADLVGVAEELRRSGSLDDAGGVAYLAEVFQADTVGADAARYAGIVREYAQLRRLRQAGCSIAAAVDARQGPSADLIEWAQRDLFALGCDQAQTGEVVLEEVLADVLANLDSPIGRGIPSGIQALDQMTGGHRAGELFVIAARPNVGKTAVALAVAGHVAAVERQPVLFASLEMGRAELGQRLLSSWGGVNGHRVRLGTLTGPEADDLFAARDRLAGAPLYVLDQPGLTVGHLHALCRRRKARHGLAMVIIDYLGLLTPEEPRQPRHEQVAVISRRLKLMARELAVPVIALSQLNRESESRAGQQPKLSDLRDSGAVEQDADAVVLLSRPDSLPSDLTMNLAKQRNGPVGEFNIRFDRATQRLSDPLAVSGRFSAFPD